MVFSRLLNYQKFLDLQPVDPRPAHWGLKPGASGDTIPQSGYSTRIVERDCVGEEGRQ